ncbi:heterokaryon incompatibility protein-domain-containing protein [Achaetomium macrosporum]|uniref:Heterokaryon incompatibility protein-domain-containing protein n=1 Tax=Achaetomium macrosporum TaxID=79813 RepID=A0AAN7C412_9PEZI|nr:heterokaryon incompatibility protein-domain-containing protein [Achaetomium macrosporum]
MRLMETSTLRLVSKHDPDIPPYAILSHTWGSDEEEVSFQELQALSATFPQQQQGRHKRHFSHPIAKREGFAKIGDSARLAESPDFKYIWIDTCCIGKTSSAELSEAINSMFQWYRNAAVCYTFLSDVPYELGPDDYTFLTCGNEERLLETSGQPPIMEALRRSKCDVTDIDIDVLKGHIGLEELSVASRYAPFAS